MNHTLWLAMTTLGCKMDGWFGPSRNRADENDPEHSE
jgi:hypothetical protein